MSELLSAAAGSPILLAVLVVGGFAVWAIERLADVNGPITRAARAWQERELRRLRRQRLLDAERRSARQETEDARVVELENEVRWLRAELRRRGAPSGPARPARIEPPTEPLRGPGRRNSGRHSPPPR